MKKTFVALLFTVAIFTSAQAQCSCLPISITYSWGDCAGSPTNCQTADAIQRRVNCGLHSGSLTNVQTFNCGWRCEIMDCQTGLSPFAKVLAAISQNNGVATHQMINQIAHIIRQDALSKINSSTYKIKCITIHSLDLATSSCSYWRIQYSFQYGKPMISDTNHNSPANPK